MAPWARTGRTIGSHVGRARGDSALRGLPSLQQSLQNVLDAELSSVDGHHYGGEAEARKGWSF